ncbi:MAG: hypothetical protein GEU93_19685 [Propionibacteriales bacterium]|nr:hypothetical protein [Propionibacteriales bacterium]
MGYSKLVRRRRLALPATLALALVVAACGGDSGSSNGDTSGDAAKPTSPRGELTVRLYVGLATSDPFQERSPASWDMLTTVYEGLTAMDSQLAPQPMLAKSWEANADATEYVFELRDDVVFHNGKAMVADDVKYSLDHYVTNGLNRSTLSYIKGVEVVDEHTVKITTKQPTGNLPADLGNPIAVPIVPQGSADDGKLATTPVGTGPFKIKEFEPNVRSRAVRQLVRERADRRPRPVGAVAAAGDVGPGRAAPGDGPARDRRHAADDRRRGPAGDPGRGTQAQVRRPGAARDERAQPGRPQLLPRHPAAHRVRREPALVPGVRLQAAR